MKRQLSIKTQMFVLAVCIFLLMGGIGLLGLGVMRTNERSINDALMIKPIKTLNEVYTRTIEDTLYRYLLGMLPPEEALQQIETSRDKITSQWSFLKEELEKQQLVLAKKQELDWLITNSMQVTDYLANFILNGDKEQLRSFMKKEWVEIYEPILALMASITDELIDEAQNRLTVSAKKYTFELLSFLAFTVFVIFFSTWLLQKKIAGALKMVSSQLDDIAAGKADLTRRVTEETLAEVRDISRSFNRFITKMSQLIQKIKASGLQVNSSTAAITTTALDLQKTLSAFEKSFVETIATVTQISKTSQVLVETMEDASAVSAKTLELATTGKAGLQKMGETIVEMEGGSSEISMHLYTIKEKVEKISKIVGSIANIANKTNLLALNAAIQSEKAGEHGLGFAVVTREIRALADLVAEDSRNIASIAKEMKSAVGLAVTEVDKFHHEVTSDALFMQKVNFQLTEIISEVEALAPRYETVNIGVQEQAEGAQRVGESMASVASDVQRALNSFKSVSLVIHQLDSDSHDLQKTFSGFKVEEE